ncbi:hypothetical protein CROQUDRAFT_654744 [Cronartium quercuum f. sp. fusiforme G11]|uniref:Uncharacterized protein n=1 Tax=Cronartium quercuum f. sp. fusiforme G11 TaxID=708437 RepID=A0A9P6NQN0_9BASI|nr:hypothetical protein CROQUDRAFT_654744 [Cronartium quercuum f. sp. fusiforme G11]
MSPTLNLFCLLGLAASCCMGIIDPNKISIAKKEAQISPALDNLLRSVEEVQFTALCTQNYDVPFQLLSEPRPESLKGFLVRTMQLYLRNLQNAWKNRSTDEEKRALQIAESHKESNFLASVLARRSKANSEAQDYDDSGLVYQPDAYKITTVLGDLIWKLRSDPQRKVELGILAQVAAGLPPAPSITLVFEIEKRLAELTMDQLKMIEKNLKSLEVVELDGERHMLEWSVRISSNPGWWHWREFCEDYRRSDTGTAFLTLVQMYMSHYPTAAAQARPLAAYLRSNLHPDEKTAWPKFNWPSSL